MPDALAGAVVVTSPHEVTSDEEHEPGIAGFIEKTEGLERWLEDLGEDGAGKTSLIRKIQGIEEYKKGRGLEYLYLNVHDEDRDDQTRCNVWILDGDLYHKGLLKFSLDALSLKDTLVILVVDMSKPWTALDSLQKWASVVREHVDKLKIPPEEMKEMEHKYKIQ
ncbi:cytoplasmic dynein 1 light intermediate chain 1-like protein [Cricetulus griseus]|uniref:Dynein light intermediate chain n=1 Tax=Cricetulus griseus TaxID=10029 RepID=A0A061I416_CRIGR|nr:cytoplasmic dynein 1 light intermediate chain 1-like protein [Cricetulus griseus]